MLSGLLLKMTGLRLSPYEPFLQDVPVTAIIELKLNKEMKIFKILEVKKVLNESSLLDACHKRQHNDRQYGASQPQLR